jgi:hypothetical protein
MYICISEEQLVDQLDSASPLCRYQYDRTAEFLLNLFDPLVAKLQALAAGVSSNQAEIQVIYIYLRAHVSLSRSLSLCLCLCLCRCLLFVCTYVHTYISVLLSNFLVYLFVCSIVV